MVYLRESPAKLSKILGTRLRLGGTSNVMACLLPVLLIASASDALKMMQVEWSESLQSLVASFIGPGRGCHLYATVAQSLDGCEQA